MLGFSSTFFAMPPHSTPTGGCEGAWVSKNDLWILLSALPAWGNKDKLRCVCTLTRNGGAFSRAEWGDLPTEGRKVRLGMCLSW